MQIALACKTLPTMPHKWCAWVSKSNEVGGGGPDTQPKKKQHSDNEQKANAYLPNVQQPLRWKEVFFQ